MDDTKRPHANNPLNVALRRLMERRNLDDAKAQRALGIYTAAAIGNYRRGDRPISSKLIDRWEEVFQEDIRKEAKTIIQTNVSRETKQTNVPQLSDRDIIEAQNYIGMHRRVYDSLEKSLEMFQKLAVDAQRNANDLTQILAGRSGPGSGPPQG